MSPVKYELGFYIPEDDILHSHCRENLKSYISMPSLGILASACEPQVERRTEADDRMYHVRDVDSHPRVGADTPALISHEICYFLTPVVFQRARSLHRPRRWNIVQTHGLMLLQPWALHHVTVLCLSETVCVLNFMTGNECPRRGYRQPSRHLLAAQ
jgi:hypothetical protein